MPKRRSNHVNVTPIKDKATGRVVRFRARLTFPFNGELGFRPAPKDFFGKTQAEAVAKRDAYVPPKEGADNETPLTAYLANEFIPYLRTKTQPSGTERPASFKAFDNRRARLNNYLIGSKITSIRNCALAKVRMGYLQPAMVEDWFKLLIQSRKVSRRNLKELRTDLRMALTYAGKRVPGHPRDYLDTAFIEAETRFREPRRVKPVFDYDAVIAALDDPSKPLEHRALVATIFCSLARPSEMFALLWSDLDFGREQITFTKAMRLTEGEDGKRRYAVCAGTKVAENRTVPLFEPALSLLRELRKTKMHSTHVFTSRGKALHNERFRPVWKAVKASLGFSDDELGFYRLKATGNSFLASKGVPPEVRAAMAGWSSVEMALEVYRTVKDDEKKAVGAVFAQALADHRGQTRSSA